MLGEDQSIDARPPISKLARNVVSGQEVEPSELLGEFQSPPESVPKGGEIELVKCWEDLREAL